MKRAQTTIELTLSLLVLTILFAGMIQLFIWASRCIVGRHNAYLKNFPTTYDEPNEFYTPEDVNLVPNIQGID